MSVEKTCTTQCVTQSQGRVWTKWPVFHLLHHTAVTNHRLVRLCNKMNYGPNHLELIQHCYYISCCFKQHISASIPKHIQDEMLTIVLGTWKHILKSKGTMWKVGNQVLSRLSSQNNVVVPVCCKILLYLHFSLRSQFLMKFYFDEDSYWTTWSYNYVGQSCF